MQSFRKQINESFFNPLLHFIPLLLFLIIDDVFGNSVALAIIYAVVVAILFYSFLLYSHLYKFLGVSYLVTTLIIGLIIFIPPKLVPIPVQPFLSEYIVLISLGLILILRSKITRFVSEKTPAQLAMTNNLEEHFRIVWILSTIIFIYIHATLLVKYTVLQSQNIQDFIQDVYVFALLLLIVYEFIRVTFIRIQLFKEEWWPIVNQEGLVIGSVQSNESKERGIPFTHPVVRMIVVNDSNVLLEKRPSNSVSLPDSWDVIISNNIRMNETLDQCVERTLSVSEDLANLKPVFLTKYYHRSGSLKQFVYLFLLCNQHKTYSDYLKNKESKWWMMSQINENLKEGIFTEFFLKELDVLKRIGILEKDTYKCTCQLKEVVYQGMNKSPKIDT